MTLIEPRGRKRDEREPEEKMRVCPEDPAVHLEAASRSLNRTVKPSPPQPAADAYAQSDPTASRSASDGIGIDVGSAISRDVVLLVAGFAGAAAAISFAP